jgi:transglutaminase-like putative cysteine protease
MPNPTRTLLALAFLLAARALGAPGAPGAVGAVDERWHIVEIGGAKAGHMVERTRRLDDGALRTESEMALRIARGPVTIDVVVNAESVERETGEPVSMRLEQRLGAATMTTDVTFDGRTATAVDTQFGQRSEPRSFDVPDSALMPGALARELERRVRAGEDRIELVAIDPTTASVVTGVYTRGDRVVVHAAGRDVAATTWKVEQSVMPGVVSTYFLDDDAEMVKGEIALGGLTLTLSLVEKDLALAPGHPAELLASTLVRPDRLIREPRETRSATYVVRALAGDLPDLPSWGAQRVTRLDGASARVDVDLSRPGDAVDPAERDAWLASSVMLDATDPQVVELAKRAAAELRGALLDDPREVARACRRFAHSYIEKKSLGVGFATAGEVARTAQGDCTEHAVLLAAILRARGIPSRVVSGLIYVDEFVGERAVFGFHMWTQALVPDEQGVERWMDLDATLPGLADFDAAHIGVAVSDLRGGERINTMAAVAPLIGNVSIAVERTRPE